MRIRFKLVAPALGALATLFVGQHIACAQEVSAKLLEGFFAPSSSHVGYIQKMPRHKGIDYL